MAIAVNFTMTDDDRTITYRAGDRTVTEIRTIPVSVFLPDQPGTWPVLFWSHGHFAQPSRSGSATPRALADAGWIVVVPTHPDSVDNPWQSLFADRFPVSDPMSSLHRTADIRHLLDNMAQIAPLVPPGYGLDGSRPAVGGHSHGAYTAALLTGAEPTATALQGQADPRFAAALLFSPQGTDPASSNWHRFTAESWATQQVPTLIVTGTEDTGPDFSSYHARLDSFRHNNAPDRWLVVAAGADHGEVANGSDATVAAATAGMAAAFLDAVIGGDAAARALLADPALIAARWPIFSQIHARPGPATLPGPDRGIVAGTTGAELLYGMAGDDRIGGGGGSDTIHGGAGYDTVLFALRREAYAVAETTHGIQVSGGGATATLTGVERLVFADRAATVSLPDWQSRLAGLTATVGGRSLEVRQVAMTPVQDPARGLLDSRVTIDGADPVGVLPTLRQGWQLATVADIDANGRPELFFFGIAANAATAGIGATWELDATGAVVRPLTHIQLRREGWQVAGAADINGLPGDEILWQHTLDGTKALWSDTDRDGILEFGLAIQGLAADPAQRIVGTVDRDRDGRPELVVFDDSTGRVAVHTLTTDGRGAVSVTTTTAFDGFAAFQAVLAPQDGLRLFPVPL